VKIASIDVGSYSCRLSIADFSNSFRIIYEEGNITSLATGLKENGYLQEEPMEETLRTIKKYIQVAKQYGAERIVLIGTEALRRAKELSGVLKEGKGRNGLGAKGNNPRGGR